VTSLDLGRKRAIDTTGSRSKERVLEALKKRQTGWASTAGILASPAWGNKNYLGKLERGVFSSKGLSKRVAGASKRTWVLSEEILIVSWRKKKGGRIK